MNFMYIVRAAFLTVVMLFSSTVGAQHKSLDLLLKNNPSALYLSSFEPDGFHGLSVMESHRKISFGGSVQHESIADVVCKSVARNFWSNSRHPGGDRNGALNQRNYGIGFKCRLSDQDPVFWGVDSLINSQRGTSFVASVGKQIDILEWNGLKYYVGGAFIALSYEMPKKRRVAYGIVPILHRGVSYELPGGWGKLGWEEQQLPMNIKLRSWNFIIEKKVNFL